MQIVQVLLQSRVGALFGGAWASVDIPAMGRCMGATPVHVVKISTLPCVHGTMLRG